MNGKQKLSHYTSGSLHTIELNWFSACVCCCSPMITQLQLAISAASDLILLYPVQDMQKFDSAFRERHHWKTFCSHPRAPWRR